jgi:hypothetical protein
LQSVGYGGGPGLLLDLPEVNALINHPAFLE